MARELQKEAEWKASSHAAIARRDQAQAAELSAKLASVIAAEATLRQQLRESEDQARGRLAVRY